MDETTSDNVRSFNRTSSAAKRAVNQMGRLRHLNCPVWEANGCTGEFPKFMAGKCVECQVDIANKDAVPTYEADNGIFYSVEINGSFIEIGKERS